MLDPSLDVRPRTTTSSTRSSAPVASIPPPLSSSSRSLSRSTQRGIDHFHALQTAMYETYSALPAEAQAALLRRAALPIANIPPYSARPSPSSSPSSSAPQRDPGATTYLASREANWQYEQQQARMPQQYRSSADYQYATRGRSHPQTWTQTSSPPMVQQAAPAPLHRVYVLRCGSCDTFLSDRGMRAVLLLKPNIVLFSTDATPSNSGPLWPGTEELAAERTCDCLTSSIGCHGCGTVIGYHIVQPCARCTNSVQQHQRSANHHRYVFHHNEVVAKERRYHCGEPGITGVRYTHPSARTSTPLPSPTTSPRPESDCKDEGSRRHRTPRAGPVMHESASLRDGDVLYWHNLVAGGERPLPVDPSTRPVRCSVRAGR